MKIGDMIAGFVLLIVVYLVLARGKESNELLQTVFGGTAVLAKTFQGR